MNDKKATKMREVRRNLDENQAFLTRKLEHYNAWLMDTKRPFTEIYPGFPEEQDFEAKSKRKRAERRSSLPLPTPKKVTRERPKKGEPTKQERAVRLVELNPNKDEAINAIMSQLNMSKAGATTYFYNAKKILGAK